jgi:uncharacterized lipoprotein YbaY
MRLNGMPFCNLNQLRLTGLRLGTALLLTIVGAPFTLSAQQPLATSTSSSTESSSLQDPAKDDTSTTLAVVDLPDAPSTLLVPQTTQTTNPTPADQKANPAATIQTTDPYAVNANGTQQTKRVLGIIPNFSSVSADVKLPPQTPKQKLILAAKNSFDYSSFFVASIQAGFAMDSNSYPEFHQGLKGYGQYYWHTLADTADENFMVSGLGPIVFHQDNRFYTLGHGSFTKRTLYAVSRVLITRTDNSNPTFNFSEVIGSGAAAGLSTLWYPKQYQTWTKVGQKWLTSDLIDGFNFWWKEWWPTANKYVFHTK